MPRPSENCACPTFRRSGATLLSQSARRASARKPAGDARGAACAARSRPALRPCAAPVADAPRPGRRAALGERSLR